MIDAPKWRAYQLVGELHPQQRIRHAQHFTRKVTPALQFRRRVGYVRVGRGLWSGVVVRVLGGGKRKAGRGCNAVPFFSFWCFKFKPPTFGLTKRHTIASIVPSSTQDCSSRALCRHDMPPRSSPTRFIVAAKPSRGLGDCLTHGGELEIWTHGA